MVTTIAAGLAAIFLFWFASHFFRASGQLDKRRGSVASMAREEARVAFEEARKIVIAQMRNAPGKISRIEEGAALELAIACLDRLDELDGKEHGPGNRLKIRRFLEQKLKREAEKWL